MQFVTTAERIADIFTKALDPVLFIKFRDQLVVSRSTLSIVAAVEKRKEPMEKAVEEMPNKKKIRI